MENENKQTEAEQKQSCCWLHGKFICRKDNNSYNSSCGGGGGCVYGLGFIGASVYYLQLAVGFSGVVMGVLKAIVWPAIVVYKLLGFLGI